MSASVAYPPRGRSRTVSPAAIAREASLERMILASRFSKSNALSEKRALARATRNIHRTQSSPSHTPGPRTPPDNHPLPPASPSTTPKAAPAPRSRPLAVHVENPDTAYAPLDPSRCSVPQPHIRPSPRASAFTSPPLCATQASSPPARLATSPRSADFKPPTPSRSSQARQRRIAVAETAFAAAQARSRRDRIAALTARGIAEEAALERERLAREAAEREARRNTVTKTPNYSPAFAYNSRQQTLPHMRQQQPMSHYGLQPLIPYSCSPPASAPVPVRRSLSDQANSSEPKDKEFTYAFPVASSRLGHWNARAQKGSAKTRRALQELLEPAPNPRAVPFEDVIAAMNGALFVEPDERPTSSSGWLGSRGRSRDLLNEDVRRRAWDVLMAPPSIPARKKRRANTDERVLQDRDCAACTAAWQRSLASLDLSLPTDTPALSPASSAGSSPRSGHSVLPTPRSWLPLSFFSRESTGLKAQPVKEEPVLEDIRHTCGRPQPHCFVAVEVDESPLGTQDAEPTPLTVPSSALFPSESTCLEPKKSKRLSLLAPMSKLLASAAHIHEVYVQATLMTLAAASEFSPPAPAPTRQVFRPCGVSNKDVRLFDSPMETKGDSPYLLRALDDFDTTARMSASSFELCPDDGHPLASTYPFFLPNYAPGPRPRPVAHPAHLRASALLNARRTRVGGSMGLLPERMLGVACDVHAGRGARGTSLKWGWKVVWEDE